MFDLMLTAGFEQIRKSDQVAVDVRLGMGQRVPHAGLCGQVDDDVKLSRVKDAPQLFAIRKIAFLKLEPVPRDQSVQSISFQRDGIIGVEIVESDDLVAAVQQCGTDVHPDKAGRSCDKVLHASR
jgi:hypothetical protein